MATPRHAHPKTLTPHTQQALGVVRNTIHKLTHAHIPKHTKTLGSFVRSMSIIAIIHLALFMVFGTALEYVKWSNSSNVNPILLVYVWFATLGFTGVGYGLKFLYTKQRTNEPEDLQDDDHTLQLLAHTYPYVYNIHDKSAIHTHIEHHPSYRTKDLAHLRFDTRLGPITAHLKTTPKTLSLSLLLPPQTEQRLARQPQWIQTLTQNAPAAAQLRIEHRPELHDVTLTAIRPDNLEISHERAIPPLLERLQRPDYGLTPPPSSNVLQDPDSMMAILDAFHRLMAMLCIPVLHNTDDNAQPTLHTDLRAHAPHASPRTESSTLPASFSSPLIDLWNVSPYNALPTQSSSPIFNLSLSLFLALSSSITIALITSLFTPESISTSFQIASWAFLIGSSLLTTRWIPTQQPKLWPRNSSQELLLQRQGETLRVVRTYGDNNPAHNTILSSINLGHPFHIDATLTPHPPSSPRLSSSASLLHIELRQTLPHGDPQRLVINVPIQTPDDPSLTLDHLQKHGHLCKPDDFFTFLWPWIQLRAASHGTHIGFDLTNTRQAHEKSVEVMQEANAYASA